MATINITISSNRTEEDAPRRNKAPRRNNASKCSFCDFTGITNTRYQHEVDAHPEQALERAERKKANGEKLAKTDLIALIGRVEHGKFLKYGTHTQVLQKTYEQLMVPVHEEVAQVHEEVAQVHEEVAQVHEEVAQVHEEVAQVQAAVAQLQTADVQRQQELRQLRTELHQHRAQLIAEQQARIAEREARRRQEDEEREARRRFEDETLARMDTMEQDLYRQY
jgi:chromosome segregation ATPase